jgi:Rieske Fe-S protein
VPVGGGKIYQSQRVAVTQPTAGHYVAFSAVCTHAGCTVSTIENGVITCPCHRSAFSASDGSVRNGPATQPLKQRTVTVDGGQIRLLD